MLLSRPILEAIREGRVSLVFRKWRRPTVKSGGSLKTAIGVLAVESVEPVSVSAISEADAKRAGHASRAALLREIGSQSEGSTYRIAVRFAGVDPRIALRRTSMLTPKDWSLLEAKLQRMDRLAKDGPWIRATLDLIARQPATRAEALATELDLDKSVFKPRVRRLKELGLTESLEIGYRLSPRGKEVLKRLRR